MGRRRGRIEPEAETCAQCRQPKPIALYLQHPDGTRVPLCQICANRWLLSDEEWPPQNTKTENKAPISAKSKVSA